MIVSDYSSSNQLPQADSLKAKDSGLPKLLLLNRDMAAKIEALQEQITQKTHTLQSLLDEEAKMAKDIAQQKEQFNQIK